MLAQRSAPTECIHPSSHTPWWCGCCSFGHMMMARTDHPAAAWTMLHWSSWQVKQRPPSLQSRYASGVGCWVGCRGVRAAGHKQGGQKTASAGQAAA